MPRRPSLSRTKEFKVYLNEENTAALELITYQPGTGRNRFGEVSRIANEAFALYFQSLREQAAWRQSMDQKSKPDSAN